MDAQRFDQSLKTKHFSRSASQLRLTLPIYGTDSDDDLSDFGTSSLHTLSLGWDTSESLAKLAGIDSPSSSSVVLGVGSHELRVTDVFEHEDYTTERTIIRRSRARIFPYFSRPSRPAPSSSASASSHQKSTTTSNFGLGGLLCFGNEAVRAAFEDDVVRLIEDRERGSRSTTGAGPGSINEHEHVMNEGGIAVTREVEVYTVETWRDQVQRLHYGTAHGAIMRPETIIYCGE